MAGVDDDAGRFGGGGVAVVGGEGTTAGGGITSPCSVAATASTHRSPIATGSRKIATIKAMACVAVSQSLAINSRRVLPRTEESWTTARYWLDERVIDRSSDVVGSTERLWLGIESVTRRQTSLRVGHSLGASQLNDVGDGLLSAAGAAGGRRGGAAAAMRDDATTIVVTSPTRSNESNRPSSRPCEPRLFVTA